MAVGDRLQTPDSGGARYSDMEVTDETLANGVKQMARLVKQVDDSGNTLSPVKGAASIANGQVTATSTSGAVVAARATRRSVLIRNTDASNSAYVGTGTVTAGNGFLLKAGESISIETVAVVNCLRATADVVLAYMEVYD